MAAPSPDGAGTPAPPVTIVVVTFQSGKTIGRCLAALHARTPVPFEVAIVDNASTDDTAAQVASFAAAHPAAPVRWLPQASNLGFSKGCNVGIAATRGSDPRRGFVVLLNPDTEVTEGWLAPLLAPLRGDVGAVGPLSNYVAGRQRFELHFGSIPKETARDPRALARALAARNAGRVVETKLLIGFCLALRRDLLEDLGALDEDLFLGNDDLELSLRLRRAGYRLLVAADSFVHHEGQRSFAALPRPERDRLVQESTDALQRKLEALFGEDAVPSPMDLWDIEWFRPTPKPSLVSIVVPVWNNLAFTRTCLRSLAQYTTLPHEVIVVDNGSTDGTPAWLASQSGVRAIRNERNLGFAAACNQGLRAARGKDVVLLNNDVMLTPEWLEGLLAHARADARVGIVGPRTNYAGGPQQVAGVGYKTLDELEGFAREFRARHRGERSLHPRITGLCMLVTAACREKVGFLDERFGIGNFEDDDYCVRARLAGFVCAMAHDVFVHHFGSQTFKALGVDYGALLEENKGKFLEKWKELLPARA